MVIIYGALSKKNELPRASFHDLYFVLSFQDWFTRDELRCNLETKGFRVSHLDNLMSDILDECEEGGFVTSRLRRVRGSACREYLRVNCEIPEQILVGKWVDLGFVEE